VAAGWAKAVAVVNGPEGLEGALGHGEWSLVLSSSSWCGEAATRSGNLSEKTAIMCLAIAVPPIAFGPEASNPTRPTSSLPMLT
jgi:hypothetical protein